MVFDTYLLLLRLLCRLAATTATSGTPASTTITPVEGQEEAPKEEGEGGGEETPPAEETTEEAQTEAETEAEEVEEEVEEWMEPRGFEWLSYSQQEGLGNFFGGGRGNSEKWRISMEGGVWISIWFALWLLFATPARLAVFVNQCKLDIGIDIYSGQKKDI